MTTFARITPHLSDQLRELPPSASSLYIWLLQRRRSGAVQEIFLDEVAPVIHYSLKQTQRALRKLLDCGLVTLSQKYTAKIFRVAAHDDRTLFDQTEMSQTKTLMSGLGTEVSQTEPSKPHLSVGLNREDQRKTTDQSNQRIKQPVKKDRKTGPIVQESNELGATDYPALLEEVAETLQQPLSPNLQRQVLSFTICRVRDALDSYREAKQQPSPIRNPEAWFAAALQRAYKPNRMTAGPKPQGAGVVKSEQREVPPGFEVWFVLAKRAGVASASSYVKGEFCIHTATGWETWAEMQAVWSLERLQSVLARPVVPTRVEEEPAMPQPTAAELVDPVRRSEILARLKGRFALPQLRDEAVRWAKEWGFVVNSSGIAERAGCG